MYFGDQSTGQRNFAEKVKRTRSKNRPSVYWLLSAVSARMPRNGLAIVTIQRGALRARCFQQNSASASVGSNQDGQKDHRCGEILWAHPGRPRTCRRSRCRIINPFKYFAAARLSCSSAAAVCFFSDYVFVRVAVCSCCSLFELRFVHVAAANIWKGWVMHLKG